VQRDVPPDEAARALTEIGRRQEQVIALSVVPVWYWWAVAVLMVGLAAAVDAHRPVLTGVGTVVFVLGVLGATGAVVLRGLRHAQPRDGLLGATGVLSILGFVAAVLAVSLPTAFGLRTAGVGHPAVWGVLVGAVLMVTAGPLLSARLRRGMLARAAGTPR